MWVASQNESSEDTVQVAAKNCQILLQLRSSQESESGPILTFWGPLGEISNWEAFKKILLARLLRLN